MDNSLLAVRDINHKYIVEGKLIIVITHRLDESLKKYDRYVIIQNTQMYMTSDFNEAISLVTKE